MILKHWDLVPGEKVELRRDDPPADQRRGVFRFRTVELVYFESNGRLFEFILRDDGDLQHGHHRWRIHGVPRAHVLGGGGYADPA